MWKQILLVAFTLTLISCAPRWHELESGYTFEEYVQDFKKTYTASEYNFRKDIFKAKLKEIINHNRNNNQWKQGVNHMTDYTEHEFKSLLGVKKEMAYLSRKHESNVYAEPSNPQVLKDLPTNVDWRMKNVVTPVKDQGRCGSCWSFASAEAIESAYAIATGQLVELSEQNILDCTPNPKKCGGTGGCGGATAELAFETVKNHGIATEWSYPYISYWGSNYQCQKQPPTYATIHSYSTLPANKQDPLLTAVANIGPIAVSVDAAKWGQYEHGVFDGCNQTNPTINHAVLLVGYGTDPALGDYWLVRNSWSPTWGEKGYIRVKREKEPRCGIDLNPEDGTGCEGGPPTVVVCGTCGILYDSAYVTVFSTNQTKRN